MLTAEGRERFIRAYDARMLTSVKLSLVGTSVTYRRALLVQARQVVKAVASATPAYQPIEWRR